MTTKKIEKQNHKNRFTKFEKARLIGSRALQISQGAPFLIKLSKKDLEKLNYDVVEIAKKEYEANVIPIEIKRNYPHME